MKILKVGETEFVRTKYSDLSGETVVTYAEPHGGKVEARRFGIQVHGKFEISDTLQLNDFARLMDSVWRDHLALRPKFVKTLTGH